MDKGTIVYVGNYELPDKNAAAHRVMSNGKIFKRLGYRMAYLGVVRADEYYEGIRRADYDENIYEEAYPVSAKQWFKHIFDTENICSVVSNYDDVRMIIVYNVPYETLRAVKKKFKNTGIRIVYDCTEWNNYAEGPAIKRLYKRFDEFEIRKFTGNCADGLIVISSLMEKQYAGKKMIKLPPLVDLEDAIWHQSREKNKLGFEFCFAGSLGNKESLDQIIKAFCRLENKETYLRIIGIEEKEFCGIYPECEADIAENNERICFMGKLSHSETVKHVLSCDCYIFIRESSRRNEAGFPTKFAESYSCGVPIITTDVSDIKNYMSGLEKGLVLEGVSEKSIIEAMEASAGMAGESAERQLDDTFDYRRYLNKAQAWLEMFE